MAFQKQLAISVKQLIFILMDQNIHHLYYEGWDCMCSAKQVSLDIFRAAVRCRSLIDGRISDLSIGLVDFSNEVHAVEVALQAAFGWTCENKHSLKMDHI